MGCHEDGIIATKKLRARKRMGGLSLIGTCFFIVGSAIVGMGVSQMYAFYNNNKHIETTAQSVELAQGALNDFFQRNGRFPCPADRTVARDTPRYGVEAVAPAPGACAGALAGTHEFPSANPLIPGNAVIVGALPVRTLGLPDSADVDGWDNRLSYAVTEIYVNPGTVPTSMNQGTIAIKDSNLNSVTSMLGNAVFAVIASGEDRRGAYNSNGKTAMPCDPTSVAGQNCDDMKPDATFRATTLKQYNMNDNSSFTSSIAFRASPALMAAGVCGPAASVATATAPTGAALCNTGTASPTTANLVGANWSWACNGTGGGAPASCLAPNIPAVPVNGSCGTANGVATVPTPSANLCSTGTPTAVTVASPYTWTCNGISGGSSLGCSAPRLFIVNGACGTANGTTVPVAPSGVALCSPGTASAVAGAGPWTWSCAGQNGGSNSPGCSANKTAPVVNGVCGAANNVAVFSAPASGLCSAGTPTALTGTGPWGWSCTGSGGGTTAACLAPLAPPPPIDGTCGTANSTVVTSAPTTNLCATGTATAVLGSGLPNWNWTCPGSGGGTTASCTARKTTACTANPFDGDLEIVMQGTGAQSGTWQTYKKFVNNLVNDINLTPGANFGLIKSASRTASASTRLYTNITDLGVAAALSPVSVTNNITKVRGRLSDYGWLKSVITTPAHPDYQHLLDPSYAAGYAQNGSGTNLSPLSTIMSPVRDAVAFQSPVYTSATLSSFYSDLCGDANCNLGLTSTPGQNNLYGAILGAIVHVRTMSNPKKTILLITSGAQATDGYYYTGGTTATPLGLHYIAAARAAEALGIRVIALTFNPSSNPWELRAAVASQHGENYFEVPDLITAEEVATNALCTDPNIGTGYIKVSSGGATGGHTCAITYNGVAKCWGNNGSGQLGVGGYTDKYSPTTVVNNNPTPGVFWTDIDAGGGSGGGTTCGLMSDGSAWCWGDNNFNQVGCYTTASGFTATCPSANTYDTPQRVITPYSKAGALDADVAGTDTSWTAINSGAGARGYACGITVSGHSWCWGSNVSGQMGDGTSTGKNHPVLTKAQVTTGGTALLDNDRSPWVQIEAGGGPTYAATCGIMQEGLTDGLYHARCWGNLPGGYTRPKPVGGGTGPTNLLKISVGGGLLNGPSACGLGVDGAIYCWGDGSAGSFGNGTNSGSVATTEQQTNAPDALHTKYQWTGVSNSIAQETFTCATTNDGKAWCWGTNLSGEFGNGTQAASTLVPVPAATAGLGSSLSWKALTTGGGVNSYACGLTTDNKIYCWGYNVAGQLGQGTASPPVNPLITSPVLVP